ncbi:hypothetical protein ACFU9Y_08340 [Streptomyces sp. NPDC057621]|uniref:hypothetical protein n=1 Tax=Streptomyces sp. NPDC057621 TaxID=3346186 RepID=UPI0036B2384C
MSGRSRRIKGAAWSVVWWIMTTVVLRFIGLVINDLNSLLTCATLAAASIATGAVGPLAPTPTEDEATQVFRLRAGGGPHHRRTRSGGEQRGATVKTAQPEEAAPWPFAQVRTKASAKYPQLPKLRVRVRFSSPALLKPQVSDLGLFVV